MVGILGQLELDEDISREELAPSTLLLRFTRRRRRFHRDDDLTDLFPQGFVFVTKGLDDIGLDLLLMARKCMYDVPLHQKPFPDSSQIHYSP